MDFYFNFLCLTDSGVLSVRHFAMVFRSCVVGRLLTCFNFPLSGTAYSYIKDSLVSPSARAEIYIGFLAPDKRQVLHAKTAQVCESLFSLSLSLSLSLFILIVYFFTFLFSEQMLKYCFFFHWPKKKFKMWFAFWFVVRNNGRIYQRLIIK